MWPAPEPGHAAGGLGIVPPEVCCPADQGRRARGGSEGPGGKPLLWGETEWWKRQQQQGETSPISHVDTGYSAVGATPHAVCKQPWIQALLVSQGQDEETKAQRSEVICSEGWSWGG